MFMHMLSDFLFYFRGGGKEVIDEYLERTKDEVEKTEPLLRAILEYLNLEVLPPSKAI